MIKNGGKLLSFCLAAIILVPCLCACSDKTDPCIKIIDRLFSAEFSFDLEKLFTLFTDGQISAFIDDYKVRVERSKSTGRLPDHEPQNRDDFIELSRKVSEHFRFGEVSFTYNITGIEDVTESYLKDRRDYFVKCGLDLSKITCVRKYTLGDVSAVFLGKFNFCKEHQTDEIDLFEYDGGWYCCSDSPLGMYGYVAFSDDYIFGEKTVEGTVREIGEGYILIDGVLLLTDNTYDFSVDDVISARVYKDSLMQCFYPGYPDWINISTLISAEPAEWIDVMIRD
ncbi:MAG: hypothetical protein IKX86_02240 [Clostridia bacterium]|nr:hypothetical protein [Clostridia bacterium]